MPIFPEIYQVVNRKAFGGVDWEVQDILCFDGCGRETLHLVLHKEEIKTLMKGLKQALKDMGD